MTGGRRSLASLSALIIVLACSGGRETGGAATDGQASDTAAAASRDTAGAPAPETGAAAAAQRETAATTRDTSPSVAQAPPVKPAPPPKPAAPPPAPPKKPAPAPTPALGTGAGAPAETSHATAPAETTQVTAAASAPLRDAYHQAPLDTVSQQVYDGWKQYNLNCARCHGEDVQGTTIAPHLIVSVRPDGSVPTKEQFVQIVCAGRPEKGMPAWCPLGLEMDKIEAIYSYVKGRSESKIHQGRPAVKQ